MEGWDGTADGRPTDLVQRRWQRFAAGGAGLVWAEATAVCHEGRANPHQLLIDASTVGQLAVLRRLFGDGQGGASHALRPLLRSTACRPARRTGTVLDASGASDARYPTVLDDLVGVFVDRAVLAGEAGFDFVDVKACHGYLGHELLSAHDRGGRYGGDFTNRTRFMRSIIEGIRAAAPGLAIGVRFSVFDTVPYVPGPDGVGIPATSGPYRYAFGADGQDGCRPRTVGAGRHAAPPASVCCAPPPAARTTARTCSGRRSSRHPTATYLRRIHWSVWLVSSPSPASSPGTPRRWS
jgi:hypothetical protein